MTQQLMPPPSKSRSSIPDLLRFRSLICSDLLLGSVLTVQRQNLTACTPQLTFRSMILRCRLLLICWLLLLLC